VSLVAKSLADPRYRGMIERLVALRHDAGLTQRDVAERLGEPRAYVSKIEQCQQRLDPLQLVEWLRAINADEKKFLTEVVGAMPSAKRKRRT
jgi:transcriptional regulator with XRE-family HTH domain